MEQIRTFKIVIAYENLAEAIHAKEMSERVALQMGSECDAWPFELLAQESVSSEANEIAAAADMIILAAHGADQLPDAAKLWIERALLQRVDTPVALVALLHEDWLISTEPPPLCGWLRQFAGRQNVNLICNLGKPWLLETADNGRVVSSIESRKPEDVVHA